VKYIYFKLYFEIALFIG